MRLHEEFKLYENMWDDAKYTRLVCNSINFNGKEYKLNPEEIKQLVDDAVRVKGRVLVARAIRQSLAKTKALVNDPEVIGVLLQDETPELQDIFTCNVSEEQWSDEP